MFITNSAILLDSAIELLLQLSKRIVNRLSALLRIHGATQNGSSDSTEPAIGLLVSKIQGPAQPFAFLRHDNARILRINVPKRNYIRIVVKQVPDIVIVHRLRELSTKDLS